jgi:antitoxin CcdA
VVVARGLKRQTMTRQVWLAIYTMRITMRIAIRIESLIMRVSDVQRLYGPAQTSKSCKARLNITVDSELLAAARQQKLNLSALMEEKIAETLKAERARQWREDNREAIAQYNERIEREGLWFDGLRKW